MNQFERAARQRKAHQIALTIDSLHTGATAVTIVYWLQSLTASEWRELAVISGQRPASAETQRAVAEIFLARVAIEAVRSEAS